MRKELLQEQQPVVYRALKNACENDRVSNAYLFSGPPGTPKHDAAILLAQSILCSNSDGLACEACNTCRRVEEGSYSDLIILDGSVKPVSKEDIDGIQDTFARTALENAQGKRVYIIEYAENASISAQNSMLKFLEEPGSGVTAILTTENSSRLLPTILSRCTILSFVPMTSEYYFAKAVEEGISKEDAFLISHIVKEADQLRELYDNGMYEKIVLMLKEYLNLDGMRRDELIVDFDCSYRSKLTDTAKAKKENMILLRGFLDLLAQFARNVIDHDGGGPTWYDDAVRMAGAKPSDYAGWIIIADEQKDKINRWNDLNLVLAQTVFKLEEYNHDHGL